MSEPSDGALGRPGDAALLAAWRRGEQQAFSELVRRHESGLLHHARALVAEAAEDAVQDAFLKLARNPPTLPPEAVGDADAERALLSAWLHRVTRNACMDRLRTETRRRRREREAAAPEATGGGMDAVEGADTRAAVERGLARLPESQREVLVLRLLGEKSYREIADVTGRKVGTVGWLISEGLKALAADLAPLVGPELSVVPETRAQG